MTFFLNKTKAYFMINFKKILCPVDFCKCSENAVRNALIIAERYHAELHLFHAILMYEDETYQGKVRTPDFSESYDILSEISDSKLSELVESKANDVSITKKITRGFSAADEILAYAADNAFDLIVMGTHGRKALGHFLLGSVAEKVVRTAHCPVLTVHEESKTIENYEHIFVPVDFSEYSQLALSYGLEIAERYDADMSLFHVVEQSIHPSFYTSGKSSVFEIDSELRDRSVEAMKEFRKKAGHEDVSTKYIITEGRAAREIIEYLENHPVDLIVIATHGLTGIEHFLLGSTTEKVIRRAKVPVLTVKKFEAKT
ncbi:universal stress protein [candidate division KSB1 bacterium]|nr:universal stress protein [candidate division KSB1 bacterium]